MTLTDEAQIQCPMEGIQEEEEEEKEKEEEVVHATTFGKTLAEGRAAPPVPAPSPCGQTQRQEPQEHAQEQAETEAEADLRVPSVWQFLRSETLTQGPQDDKTAGGFPVCPSPLGASCPSVIRCT